MDLKELKSGSDIRGTAFKNLDLQSVSALAKGFFAWLKGKRIALGHDSRLSASALSEAVIKALMDCGAEVYFFGLCSTPSMFMATVLNNADGAIMLTASHHPADKNGMKFFTKAGGVSSKKLSEIIETAENLSAHNAPGQNTAEKFPVQKSVPEVNGVVSSLVEKDFLRDYCGHMCKIFINALGQMPLKGLKIAVDAGCGSAGFYASRILEPLGADISGSQYLQPDGNFPYHAPNPENSEAMLSISERVKETKSDLGVIFDADGDRAAIVLSDGSEINRNRLIALVSAIILRDNKGAHIVTDSVTSEGLKEFIENKGGVHIRYKRGYQNVIAYAKQLNKEGKNAPLAIETSSHAAFADNYFLDDGAYLAAVLIIEAVKLRREGKTLSQLIKDLKEPKEEKEIRLNLSGPEWKKTGERVLIALEECGKKYKIADDSHEGIRVYIGDKGFFMARLSVHDPVIPINIEANFTGGAKEIARIVYSVVNQIQDVELTPLIKFLS